MEPSLCGTCTTRPAELEHHAWRELLHTWWNMNKLWQRAVPCLMPCTQALDARACDANNCQLVTSTDLCCPGVEPPVAQNSYHSPELKLRGCGCLWVPLQGDGDAQKARTISLRMLVLVCWLVARLVCATVALSGAGL